MCPLFVSMKGLPLIGRRRSHSPFPSFTFSPDDWYQPLSIHFLKSPEHRWQGARLLDFLEFLSYFVKKKKIRPNCLISFPHENFYFLCPIFSQSCRRNPSIYFSLWVAWCIWSLEALSKNPHVRSPEPSTLCEAMMSYFLQCQQFKGKSVFSQRFHRFRIINGIRPCFNLTASHAMLENSENLSTSRVTVLLLSNTDLHITKGYLFSAPFVADCVSN